MNTKKQSRIRRARRARLHIRDLGANRLTVHRTPRHMYAQVISPCGSKVLASASTLEEALRGSATGNKAAAKEVGTLIATRAKEQVSLRSLSTVLASNTMAAFKFLLTLHVKPV